MCCMFRSPRIPEGVSAEELHENVMRNVRENLKRLMLMGIICYVGSALIAAFGFLLITKFLGVF